MTEQLQRTPEWYEQRKGRITGSKIGAILGLSPFSTPDDVMREMVREYHGADREFKGNIATEYGTENEANAIEDYKMETGNDVEEAPFVVHPDFDWLGASPDGYVGETKLIEIKCPFGKRHDQNDDDFLSAEEQPHYLAQMQYQMFCTGRFECDFYQWSAYASNLETIKFSPEYIAETMPVLEAFYQRYLEERKPENAWRYLDGGEIAQRYKMAKAALEAAKAELDEAKDALIEATNGEGGKIGDLNVTKAERKGSIAYAKAVKELLPDADLSKYQGKSTSYWVVR
ncbi:exonuclease [Idiomarinaceae phage Phi1M2-2]|uniref:exonuclease n=1 Tax=Idiomarinaceae phage Phi1M2-2 TaxID=1527515 RepID=UPI0004F6AA07|nr:exonuclease [Idiomarinaceae phage Phi1M2-2]AIM40816.1 putative Yqaj-like alkaline DNA exonuclease [Idiomarinaceae phage Phi1M2-2]